MKTETEQVSIVDSLKRLERAGTQHSKTTDKLFEAVDEIATIISCEWLSNVCVGEMLPRNYSIVRLECDYEDVEGTDPGLFLQKNSASGSFTVNGFGDFRPKASQLVEFAEDLAGGWLTELAEYLEAETDEANTQFLATDDALVFLNERSRKYDKVVELLNAGVAREDIVFDHL